MKVKYTNYKGETYYLHKGIGKKGSSQYSFSKNEIGTPAKSIPEGYEVYGDPNGRVFLRKIAPNKISDEEVSVVENSIRQYSNLKDYKIDIKGKAITIYLPDQEIDDLRSCFDPLVFANHPLLDKSLKNLLTYSPVMRYILTDEKERKFRVERAEFLNDDWFLLDGSKDLQKLSQKYCRHLGKDSFYDLLKQRKNLLRSGLSSKANSLNLSIIDSAFEAFRQANRKHLHHIWRRAQDGQLDGLGEEERRLAEIMLAHSDEYFNQFEFADVLADRDFNPESEVNPFMHVALHALLEKQLKDHEPIEALQFYNAMLRNKCTAHEAIHLLMGVLLRFLFPIFKKRSSFDLDGYRKLLKIYKTRKPDKIMALLDSEPDSSETEEVDERNFQVFDEMRAAMKGQAFKSIEEAQAFADAWLGKKNAEPRSDFLGLSSEQLHRLLYRAFEETSDIVTLNRDLSNDKILEIPIVKEAVYFLRRLGELQPLRATAKGNLPQAFACELHDRFPEDPEFPYPIVSEEGDTKLSALRHILNMCGWIKKRNQKFYLTQKGLILNKKGFGADDFHHLFQTYTQKFNWASRDLYPELGIIQQAFLFSCYILHKKAKTYVNANELSTYFIQAFPAALNTEEGYLSSEESYRVLKYSFYIRFIERFCEYFGLVSIQKKEKRLLQLDYLIRTTSLFDELFQWKLEGV